MLYNYLKDNFEKCTTCKEDLEKLKTYRDSSFTCDEIREDKESVLKYLEGCYGCKKRK